MPARHQPTCIHQAHIHHPHSHDHPTPLDHQLPLSLPQASLSAWFEAVWGWQGFTCGLPSTKSAGAPSPSLSHKTRLHHSTQHHPHRCSPANLNDAHVHSYTHTHTHTNTHTHTYTHSHTHTHTCTVDCGLTLPIFSSISPPLSFSLVLQTLDRDLQDGWMDYLGNSSRAPHRHYQERCRCCPPLLIHTPVTCASATQSLLCPQVGMMLAYLLPSSKAPLDDVVGFKVAVGRCGQLNWFHPQY
jgi:hypothetical protein